jgi:hypothetical protein
VREHQLPLREVGLVSGAAHDPSVLQECGAQNAESDELGKVAGVSENLLAEHNPGHERADHPSNDATHDGGRADSREEDETWQMKMMRIDLRRKSRGSETARARPNARRTGLGGAATRQIARTWRRRPTSAVSTATTITYLPLGPLRGPE